MTPPEDNSTTTMPDSNTSVDDNSGSDSSGSGNIEEPSLEIDDKIEE